MPGTGHSHRFKSSISNRNTKPAFQVLAPWNSRKNGEKNQVAVSTGGDDLNFKLMGAKMMSNYKKASDVWELDCSLVVLGNKIVDGSAIIHGNVDICGNLRVWGKVTDLSDVDICGNLRVWGKVTDLSDVDICGNLKVKDDATFNSNVDICGNLTIKGHTEGSTAYFTDLSAGTIYDVSDNILTLGNHETTNNGDMRGIFASYKSKNTSNDEFAFFGLDPSFNGGAVQDSFGQFLFQTDASFNNSNVPNIYNGQPGRACFGTLDISGSTRYGGGSVPGTGAPTINVTGQAVSSMHLVGKTIIAQNLGAPARLDISGGLNIVGDISANEATVGGTFAIDYNTVDISGGLVDIYGGGIVTITSTTSDVEITGAADVNVHAATNINIGGSASIVDIRGSSKVVLGVGVITGAPLSQIKLSDGSGAYIDMSGGQIDISGDDVTITGGPTSISLKSQTINIGEPGGTVEIQGNVKVDDAVTFVVTDLSATNIDVSGTLTVNGGRIDMSGTNTAVGTSALSSNTIGIYNVATGFQALTANTEGNHNIATGAQALTANIDGDHNVATGFQALAANDSGSDNIATGYRALFSNTSGNNNIATGTFALYPNTSGDNNVATGYQALQDNIGGSYNVATGSLALQDNIGGSYNVATGYKALYDNTDGSFNTAIGYQAGNGQIDISNTINVGYDTSCNASNTACIGNANITDVYFGGTSGNAKLDCSGIVIGSQGITLPQITATTGQVVTGGFTTSVVANGLSGRIQLGSSSTLNGSSSGGISWTNTTLLDDSLVLLTLDSSKNSINPWDSMSLAMYNTPGANGKGIVISNNSTSTWTMSGGEAYYINFLIINPT